MARLQEGHNNSRFVAYLSGEFGQFNLAISIHTFNAFEHTTSSIYTHGIKAPERCKHHNGKAQEAERWASGAPESGSGADAGGRRLDAVVRCGVLTARLPWHGTSSYTAPLAQWETVLSASIVPMRCH